MLEVPEEHFLAIVFRHHETFIFDPTATRGPCPYLSRLAKGMPLPPTMGFEHFSAMVRDRLADIAETTEGFEADDWHDAQISLTPDVLSTWPLGNGFFTLAIVDVSAKSRDRFALINAPMESAMHVMAHASRNFFFHLIALGYTTR